ncbi:MAG: GDYXXLXY domain-containing protein [Myxococcales bacterium FL481]|nr:MAG: GDYXXLXY domain-containing protein [Myxococcales bacterium FL481]
MKHQLISWISLALPVSLVVGVIVHTEWTRATHTKWRLPIAGSDPRDLLRGRYLRFRFDVADPADGQRHDSCVCLDADAERHGRLMACDVAQSRCAEKLDSSVWHRGQRFYVAEARARDLEFQLIDSSLDGQAFVEFVVDSRGRLHLLQLELGEEVVDTVH